MGRISNIPGQSLLETVSLENLSDVDTTSPADNDVLAYDTATGEWINQTASQAGLASSSEGVTGGNAHDHSGGDGAQIDHTTLSNKGTNTHTQIDTAVSNSVSHIANTSNPHSVTLAQVGGTTDHGVLSGLGDDDHALYLLASDATNRTTFATNWTDLTDTLATTLHKHDHGGMDGLADDDHTQYLLASGSRALAGAWDMGSQALTNVNIDSGTINGITDLAVADGGTGASTLTDSGVLVGNGTGAIQATAVGDAGQVLTSNGAGNDPTFQAASGGAGVLEVQVFS